MRDFSRHLLEKKIISDKCNRGIGRTIFLASLVNQSASWLLCKTDWEMNSCRFFCNHHSKEYNFSVEKSDFEKKVFSIRKPFWWQFHDTLDYSRWENSDIDWKPLVQKWVRIRRFWGSPTTTSGLTAHLLTSGPVQQDNCMTLLRTIARDTFSAKILIWVQSGKRKLLKEFGRTSKLM